MSIVEQLFANLALTTIDSHVLFLERARRETDRGRRVGADIALGTYIVARLVDALLDFDGTPEAQTALAWQRDATAKQIGELPQSAPEVSHLSGIVEAVQLDSGPRSTLAVSLTAYAYFLEHEGHLEEALDVLALSARTREAHLSTAELASYALFAGKLNRLLSRWPQALVCYQAAEEVGRASSDLAVMLRGRLHQGAIARGQGNLPKAREIAEAVAAEAADLGLPQVQGLAYADLSAVYSLQGSPLEGVRAAYAAFLVATTAVDRMSALGDLAISLGEIGATDQARLALEIVANTKTDFRLRTNALLELMDLESAAGNRLAFERHRAAAEAHRDQMPPSMLVDYLFKIGVGQTRFDLPERARESLALARQTAEAHALNRWYFLIEEALGQLGNGPVPVKPQQSKASAPDLREASVVQEVELGLREFSVAAALA